MTTGLFVASLFAALGTALCSNYTVGREAYLDFHITPKEPQDEPIRGRIVIALFTEALPMTTYSFAMIAKGFKKANPPHQLMHYKNSYVHRIVPDLIVQMGDVTVGDGSGGRSIYAPIFDDENFFLSHRSAGWVSMANHGPDSNQSQFFLTLNKARWLDNKNVVFGRVIEGMELLKTLGSVEPDQFNGVPMQLIKITASGLYKLDKEYDLSEKDLDREDDIGAKGVYQKVEKEGKKEKEGENKKKSKSV
ncbi:PREDICTED: peptidyl-prolyl cis-trans isomerase H-like [Priapulus caudatus]|uniref:Peptidyl-prolyl cis-trans isomerase n=1 Tax=Priapulus caudatus TaxID=37621 RepID=A0ABM1DQ61_PRICU|nr:PREDICTED: peptidyl-prolyl cis-trans isomerase H-like [Priapulus caudatus]